MTTDDLTRAKEITEEIYTLQNALSELNAAKMFSCDDIGCGPSYRTKRADAFLSEVHIGIKNTGVQKITSKIKELEKEFKAL